MSASKRWAANYMPRHPQDAVHDKQAVDNDDDSLGSAHKKRPNVSWAWDTKRCLASPCRRGIQFTQEAAMAKGQNTLKALSASPSEVTPTFWSRVPTAGVVS